MKWMIIGHRGTGKTSLLTRWKSLTNETINFIDLDSEIERELGMSISSFFVDQGERAFRDVEQRVFSRIYANYEQFVVAVGAGFQIASAPKDIKLLWLRRQTDSDGRIFLDRPRLNLERRPLDEYLERFEMRQRLYADFADQVLDMPEGQPQWSREYLELEKSFLKNELPEVNGYFCLLPEHIEPRRSAELLNSLRGKNVIFEIRDDIFTPEMVETAFARFTNEKKLFSIRESLSLRDKKRILAWVERSDEVDWDVNLGKIPQWLSGAVGSHWILSNHSHHLSVFDDFSQWDGRLKWSPFVVNFRELERGLSWFNGDRQKRSFLPRSHDGSWKWVRLFLKSQQTVNFFRMGIGSAVDQPSLLEWLMAGSSLNGFAAVLGDPILHSWSPLFHHDFFAQRKLPFYAVRVNKEDWDKAIATLRTMGLRAAAVTAPLKDLVHKLILDSENLGSLNTLAFTDQKIMGINTDEKGFREVVSDVMILSPMQQGIAVWGGGGTLESVKSVLPKAIYFAARTGSPRPESVSPSKDFSPLVLIWAAGNGADIQFPPESWRPKCVLDLSYRENSLGREYAQKLGALFISGEKMFLNQAIHQQNFWREIFSLEVVNPLDANQDKGSGIV